MSKQDKRKYKVVHIIKNDKFINDFYHFIDAHFSRTEHLFIYVVGEPESRFSIPVSDNVININNKQRGMLNTFRLSKTLKPYCDNAEKIIFHSFYAKDIVRFLFMHQYLLPKSYWVMWGADLYNYTLNINSAKYFLTYFMAKRIKGKFSGYITYLRGDYEIAQKYYGAKDKYFECIMYPSNVFTELPAKERKSALKTILVGNSADPTNNHEFIFKKLAEQNLQGWRIVVPLSYGNKVHADKIIKLGTKLFGDKFEPLTKFLLHDDYLQLLNDIDIAIFAHERQQAMGTIITLLGLEKKIYMKPNISSTKYLVCLGTYLCDVNLLNDIDIDDDYLCFKNKRLVKNIFNIENLKKQWASIFEA